MIIFLAVCAECGATGTLNVAGGIDGGSHASHCEYFPKTVGTEDVPMMVAVVKAMRPFVTPDDEQVRVGPNEDNR